MARIMNKHWKIEKNEPEKKDPYHTTYEEAKKQMNRIFGDNGYLGTDDLTGHAPGYGETVVPPYRSPRMPYGALFHTSLWDENEYARQKKLVEERKDREEMNTQINVSIAKIVFNGRATIVFWGDGEKTVVQCMSGEVYDRHAAVAQALAKRVYGSTNAFHSLVDEKGVRQTNDTKKSKSNLGNRGSKSKQKGKNSRGK